MGLWGPPKWNEFQNWNQCFQSDTYTQMKALEFIAVDYWVQCAYFTKALLLFYANVSMKSVVLYWHKTGVMQWWIRPNVFFVPKYIFEPVAVITEAGVWAEFCNAHHPYHQFVCLFQLMGKKSLPPAYTRHGHFSLWQIHAGHPTKVLQTTNGFITGIILSLSSNLASLSQSLWHHLNAVA